MRDEDHTRRLPLVPAQLDPAAVRATPIRGSELAGAERLHARRVIRVSTSRRMRLRHPRPGANRSPSATTFPLRKSADKPPPHPRPGSAICR
jgi:hypothetical protein